MQPFARHFGTLLEESRTPVVTWVRLSIYASEDESPREGSDVTETQRVVETSVLKERTGRQQSFDA